MIDFKTQVHDTADGQRAITILFSHAQLQNYIYRDILEHIIDKMATTYVEKFGTNILKGIQDKTITPKVIGKIIKHLKESK